jgi:hypothetical protein
MDQFDTRLAAAAKSMAERVQARCSAADLAQLEMITRELEQHKSGLPCQVRTRGLLPNVIAALGKHFQVLEIELSDGDYYSITPLEKPKVK